MAASLCRAAAATLGDGGDVYTYVGDPLIAARVGAGDREAHILRVILWSFLGANVAWAKVKAGSGVTWIGAHITCAVGSVDVALPLETTGRWARELGAVRLAGRADARTVRVLAGRGAWAAGVVPELGPWGLVAVMYYGGKPLAYVSDTITMDD